MAFRHYRKLFLKQGRRCAICRKRSKNPMLQASQVFDLCVDHCHVTGKVRGLLCGGCNSGLGFFADNPETLKAAIEYLQTTAAEDYSPFGSIMMPKEYRERVVGQI